MPNSSQHELIQFGIALVVGVIVAYLIPPPYGAWFLGIVFLGGLAIHAGAAPKFAAWLAAL